MTLVTRIADIITDHHGAATTAEIAHGLQAPEANAEVVMAILVANGWFRRVGQGWGLEVAPDAQGTSLRPVPAPAATHLAETVGGRL